MDLLLIAEVQSTFLLGWKSVAPPRGFSFNLKQINYSCSKIELHCPYVIGRNYILVIDEFHRLTCIMLHMPEASCGFCFNGRECAWWMGWILVNDSRTDDIQTDTLHSRPRLARLVK